MFYRRLPAGFRCALPLPVSRRPLPRARALTLRPVRTGRTRRGAASRPKARAAEVTLFTRQLASLLRAGLPLAPSLDLLAQSPGPRGRAGMPRIVGALARDITAGLRFSAALERHPAQFGALYCQLVAVGEASGSLAGHARARCRGSASAPPPSAPGYAPRSPIRPRSCCSRSPLRPRCSSGSYQRSSSSSTASARNCPGPTQFVIALSAAAARWSVPAPICAVMSGFIATYVLRRSEAARLSFARFSLRLPIAGSLLAILCAARWSRALGTFAVGRHAVIGRVRFVDARHRQRVLRPRYCRHRRAPASRKNRARSIRCCSTWRRSATVACQPVRAAAGDHGAGCACRRPRDRDVSSHHSTRQRGVASQPNPTI